MIKASKADFTMQMEMELNLFKNPVRNSKFHVSPENLPFSWINKISILIKPKDFKEFREKHTTFCVSSLNMIKNYLSCESNETIK